MITLKLRFSMLQLSKTKLANFRLKKSPRNITPQKKAYEKSSQKYILCYVFI